MKKLWKSLKLTLEDNIVRKRTLSLFQFQGFRSKNVPKAMPVTLIPKQEKKKEKIIVTEKNPEIAKKLIEWMEN